MASALLAAAAAIIGVVVGRFWDARSESTRWRRDQKTLSYQRVVEQFQALYENIRTCAVTIADHDTYPSLAALDNDGFSSWDSAVAAVWLHGSADVVVTVTELDEAVGRLLKAVTTHEIATEPEWNKARMPARQAFERFIAAARKELHLPPVPVRIFTHPPRASDEA